MYELDPKDARDLARMLGEIDHDNELEQLKIEQARQRVELLKLQKEKAQRQLNTRPEPQKRPKTGGSDIAYIITLLVMFSSVLTAFIFLCKLLYKY